MLSPAAASFPRRLALVLGSGGVRSIAALGIAERLAREGIRPDLVVGCSSGALFGAQVAQGLRGEEALRMATTLWSAELTQQRRWRAYLQLVAPQARGLRRRLRAARRPPHRRAHRQRLRRGASRTPAHAAARGRHRRGHRPGRGAHARPPGGCAARQPGRAHPVSQRGRRRAAAADARVVLSLGFFGGLPRRVDRVSRLVAQTSTTLINNLMQARTDAAQARGQQVIALALDLDRPVGLWETAAMSDLFEAGWRAAEARLPDIAAALALTPPRERELTFIE